MAQKIVAANWKMQGTKHSVQQLLAALTAGLADVHNDGQVILFAPAIYLPTLEKSLQNSKIHYGGQTASEYTNGAYTGEISTTMLTEFGCRYVLVGHSERRQLYQESDTVVANKFAQAQAAGLIPMLCVGETLAQRESGETFAVIEQQLQAVLDKVGIAALANAVLAYEPVWAIGTGKTATPEQAQAVHAQIRQLLAAQSGNIATQLPLLYGGSVKAANAAALFAMPDIDGALVGGASLDAKEFIEIVKAI